MPSVPSQNPPSSTSTSGIAESTDGSRVIPASTRPDGTTRKEIKIRPGYRPPEDVELYKNRNAVAFQARGKEWKDGVPGAVMVSDDEEGKPGTAAGIKNARKRAAKKKAKENAAAAAAAAVEVEVEKDGEKGEDEKKPSLASAKTKAAAEGLTEEEKEKHIKALRKKIRQATDLKAKKESGESLLPEQLEKVTRILELTRQLEAMGVKE